MKFRSVAMKPEEFPATYPIISNPKAEEYTNEVAQHLSFAFDISYTLMLHAFEQSFKAKAADPYFNIVLNVMHDVLPNLARALMQTPALEDGDPAVGPNAAPSWICIEKSDVTPLQLIEELIWVLEKIPNRRDLITVKSLLQYALEKTLEIKNSMNRTRTGSFLKGTHYG